MILSIGKGVLRGLSVFIKTVGRLVVVGLSLKLRALLCSSYCYGVVIATSVVVLLRVVLLFS